MPFAQKPQLLDFQAATRPPPHHLDLDGSRHHHQAPDLPPRPNAAQEAAGDTVAMWCRETVNEDLQGVVLTAPFARCTG